MYRSALSLALVALLAACGGTTSGGSGGANGGGSGGASGSGASGGGSGSGRMTEAEWHAAQQVLVGPHEIWTYDSCEDPYEGSMSVRVGPEYSVVPTFGFEEAADFDVATNIVFDVVPEPYCVSSADCTEQPGGVCQGSIADAFCQYPEPLPPDDCSVDADCTKKPDGTCVPPVGFEEYRVCYPTGVCEEPSGTCTYASDAPCTGDADCSELAGGKCILPVENTTCRYGTCFEDDDCGLGDRCGCGQCLAAACGSDEDCPESETCEVGPSWCLGDLGAFHCTTPLDECTAGEPDCAFQPGEPGHWGTERCLIK